MARTAPAYEVPPRKVVAVEHPLVIKNLENGLKTFGRNKPFERVSKEFLSTYYFPHTGLVISLVTSNRRNLLAQFSRLSSPNPANIIEAS